MNLVNSQQPKDSREAERLEMIESFPLCSASRERGGCLARNRCHTQSAHRFLLTARFARTLAFAEPLAGFFFGDFLALPDFAVSVWKMRSQLSENLIVVPE